MTTGSKTKDITSNMVRYGGVGITFKEDIARIKREGTREASSARRRTGQSKHSI